MLAVNPGGIPPIRTLFFKCFVNFLLENGRHRSTKMWYCRLYHIVMLQHLDAWNLPYESDLKKLILQIT